MKEKYSGLYTFNEDVFFEIIYIDNDTPLINRIHIHNYYELYFFISGQTRYLIDGVEYAFKKGDFIIIPPNVPHRSILDTSPTPYTGYAIFITLPFLQNLAEMEEKIAYPFRYALDNKQYIFHTPLPTWHGILSAFQMIDKEFHNDKYCHHFAAYTSTVNLIILLSRTVYYLTNKDEAVKPNEELLMNIKNYLDVNYFIEISLEETAQKFFIGSSTLSHLFKEQMGIPFYQYVLQLRLEAAKNDILANKPASKVYRENGFKDYSNFYKAFKKRYGVSPTKYYDVVKHSDSSD